MGKTLQERFEAKYIPEPNSGCWLWIGSYDSKGYGQLRMPDRLKVATHIALELSGRPVPRGLCACHRCDTPACVNPDHLFIGTHKDNSQDSVRKGRASKPPLAKKGQGLKDACYRGHSLSGDNLYTGRGGYRACVECRRIFKREMRADLVAQGLTTRGTPRQIFTPDDIRAIRADGRSAQIIANEYGVTAANIRMIRRRATWAHVE